MEKTIVLVGTLDTKGLEVGFVRDRIAEQGYKVIVVDAGILDSPSFKPDVTREEVARAGGTRIEDLVALGNEGKAIEPMMKGVVAKVQELHRAGRIAGILSLGGSMGTAIGTAAMRALPFGIPKVMVTTMATAMDMRHYLGIKDITVIPSPTDIVGLNRVTRRMLMTAAGAMVGMVKADPGLQPSGKPLVATNMRGDLTAGLTLVKSLLEIKGYEVVVFHAVGSGGRVQEEWVEQGVIDGVLELSLAELVDHQFGGLCDAGPSRLEAAGEKGIPQVVATGGLTGIGAIFAQLPEHLKARKRHEHNPGLGVVRTNKEEMAIIAKVLAQKLHKAKGPTAVIIPLRGFAPFDREGEDFYDPETNQVFIDVLKENLDPRIRLVEVDAHINDLVFAERAVALFDELMSQRLPERMK